MKDKRWLVILLTILAFICVVCAVAGGILYIRARNQPPSTVTNDAGYYIRGTTVYYLGGFPSTAFEVEGADAGTFQIIDSQYAKDASQVYFNGVIIPDSDPAAFEVMELWFSRDAKHVYISGTVFSDDPANFEILGDSLYRDSQHIYWSTNIISDDPAGLEILYDQDYHTYIRDSQVVFVNGNPISNAEAATFEVLAAGYGRDTNQVYYFDQAMPADPPAFEILENPYSRDSRSVFWMEHVIPDANPQTFHVLNADFECSADSEHAYYQDQLISGFDPATIPVDAYVTNCTDTGIFFSQ
jgi:hypothetical protein